MPRIVIAGVSGCGKTTVGKALAERIGAEFLDADDFHPPANREKMRAGVPLDDDDRAPWLDRLGAELSARPNVVLACSALKHSYRDRLRGHAGGLRFVVLTATREELERRMAAREHFMPVSLLDSQLEVLELGEDVVVVENTGRIGEVVDAIVAG